jgi:hypothetical protein
MREGLPPAVAERCVAYGHLIIRGMSYFFCLSILAIARWHPGLCIFYAPPLIGRLCDELLLLSLNINSTRRANCRKYYFPY